MNICLRQAIIVLTCLFILFLFSFLVSTLKSFIEIYSKDSRTWAVCKYIGLEMISEARATYNSDRAKSYKHFGLCFFFLKSFVLYAFFFFFFLGRVPSTCPVFFSFISLLYLHNSFLWLITYKLTWSCFFLD